MAITPTDEVDKSLSNFTYKNTAYWVKNQVSGFRLITSDLLSKAGLCAALTY